MIANSSPPIRAMQSEVRSRRRRVLAIDDQQLIADAVAVRVVDELEAVEINDQQRRRRRRAALALGDLAAQLVLEGPAVVELGEVIVIGEVLEGQFEPAAV